MWFIDFLYFGTIFLCIGTVLSATGVLYLLYKGAKQGELIKRKTYELGNKLNNEKIEDYITFVNSVEIPNRKVYWNTLKAGYRLIIMNGSIDDSTKEKLKVTMLSKGILVD